MTDATVTATNVMQMLFPNVLEWFSPGITIYNMIDMSTDWPQWIALYLPIKLPTKFMDLMPWPSPHSVIKQNLLYILIHSKYLDWLSCTDSYIIQNQVVLYCSCCISLFPKCWWDTSGCVDRIPMTLPVVSQVGQCWCNYQPKCFLWPLLLTWFNFNPSMDK